jgi:hypothetical protein
VKTFLIDLRSQETGLGAAGPLLYPLEQPDGIHPLTPTMVDDPTGQLEDLAGFVRITLVRERSYRWSAVLLVDLDDRTGNGSDGALLTEVERIQTHFLKHLTDHRVGPARTYIVALDTIDRDNLAGEPKNQEAARRWKHDQEALGATPDVDRLHPLRGMSVLRFPYRRSPEPDLQRDRLRLAYLTLALHQIASEDDPLGRERMYEVAEIQFDENQVARCIADYVLRLQEAENDIRRRLDGAGEVELQLIGDPDCGCGARVSSTSLSGARFGWLRRNDLAVWLQWGQETASALRDRFEEGRAMLQKCLEGRTGRRFDTAAETCHSLGDEARRVEGRLAAAREKVNKLVPAREERWDWDAEMRSRTPRMKALLEARPRPQAFVVFTALAVLLALVTALPTVPDPGAASLIPPALLVLAGVAVATALSIRSLHAPMVQHARAMLERSQRISKLIGERVDRQRQYLEALCEAEAARQDMEAIARARVQQKWHRSLLTFHRDQIRRHLSLIEPLKRLLPTALPDASTSGRTREWPLEVPPHRHDGYVPWRRGAAGATSEFEFLVGTQCRKYTWTLTGLDRIGLRADRYYEPAGR